MKSSWSLRDSIVPSSASSPQLTRCWPAPLSLSLSGFRRESEMNYFSRHLPGGQLTRILMAAPVYGCASIKCFDIYKNWWNVRSRKFQALVTFPSSKSKIHSKSGQRPKSKVRIGRGQILFYNPGGSQHPPTHLGNNTYEYDNPFI